MARTETFDVTLDETCARCRLSLPKVAEKVRDKNGERSLPVVLLCQGVPDPTGENGELGAQITAALVESAFAVATIVRRPDAAPARLAHEAIDNAAAVFHGLVTRDDLDITRVCVLGHSIGCIVAACLSRRTDQIARLCLMSPITTAALTARFEGEPDPDAVLRLGATGVPPAFFDDLVSVTPEQDVATHDRPTLILHGAADRMVRLADPMAYRDAIEAAGHDVDFVQVALADHLYSGEAARSACLEQVTRFFSAAHPQRATARS